MGNRQFKDALYGQFGRIGKALGNPHRLELVELLAQGERTVEALARESGLSLANASQHLQVLREAHLVEARREGLYAFYRLASPEVSAVVRSMRRLAEAHLAEVDRLVATYLKDRDSLEAVERKELLARLREGHVTVLDVRPDEEYRQGHIAGAISIPVDALEARLKELPRGREVVAYCRGPYCVYADEAVRVLRARGRKARRLADGFPEWQAAGLPVEAGPSREAIP
ncbi:MAG: metalloregulator ArsR/SmtB family transcription factor [Myxococcaceae bacterium]|nr:metalloregulator ArsR/SmtB family transcription factor [Myxococcaceae bacterium]